LALVAGAAAPDALVLGVAMTLLQAAIGIANDIADADADAGRKPGKPIPAGLVSKQGAVFAGGVATALGIGLSGVSGPGTVAIAVLGLGVGFSYDLWFKGTAWSWLPFAVGVPLLPVYAWFGATGSLDAAFAVLVPAAVVAGAALAIGNARADIERDEASGVQSIATALGSGRALAVQVLLFTAIGVIAVVSAAGSGASRGQLSLVAVAALVPLAAAAMSRNALPSGRERAWEVEAIGVALLGVAWLWVALA
jgi:4-hydroxybenzoate polyprenyltransferase